MYETIPVVLCPVVQLLYRNCFHCRIRPLNDELTFVPSLLRGVLPGMLTAGISYPLFSKEVLRCEGFGLSSTGF